MNAKNNIFIKIGAIFSIIGGIFWCLTIIGAIIGIPAILFNWAAFKGKASNNSWNSGLERLWTKRDIKFAALFGFLSSLLGGILIIIGQWLVKSEA